MKMHSLLIALVSAVSLSSPASAQRLVVYGDSIPNGLGLTASQMWRNQLGAAWSLPVVNRSANGDMAGDASMDSLVFQPLSSDIVTVQIGTNDQRIYGVSSGLQEISTEALRDVIVKATAPQRVLPSAMTLGGAWTVTGSPFWGSYTDNAGSTAPTTVCGSTVWVGYIANQLSFGHSQATVTIDGALVDTISSDAGAVALETQNNVAAHTGIVYFPATKRYGVSPNCHSVQIATTVAGERFYLEYVAGSDQSAGAKVYLSNIIPIGASCVPPPCGTPANLASYNASIASLAAELASDGRSVTLVDNNSALNLATDYQADQLHPNAGGNMKEEAEFYAAMTALPAYADAKIQIDALGNLYGVRNDGTGRVKLQASP